MKKTIAILLACIMLMACAPLNVFAAGDIVISTGDIVTWDGTEIADGQKLVVKGSLYVDNKMVNKGSISVENGGSITFKSNGRLENYSTVTVKGGGSIYFDGMGRGKDYATLFNTENGVISFAANASGRLSDKSEGYNYGDIINSGRITKDGDLKHNVTIPGSYELTFNKLETWNREPTTVKFEVSYYMYKEGDTDDAYAIVENFKPNVCGLNNPVDVLVSDGEKLFVMITPKIEKLTTVVDGEEKVTMIGEWVDAARIKLNAGTTTLDVTTILETKNPDAVRILEYGGVFTVKPTNAIDLEVATTKYKDLVKIFKIELPRTEAYYVITDNNDVDEVSIEFGDTLSFRVVLEPDYDKSEPYVYVNSIYQEPADYGYYRIKGPLMSDGYFAETGGVQDDLTITVMGVSSNESKEQLSGLVAMVQEILSIIQEIFSYFTSLFEGLGSLGGTTVA